MAKDNLIKRSWRQLVFDVPRFRTNAKSRRRVLWQLMVLGIAGCVWGLYVGGLAFYEYKFAGGWWAVLWVGIMYALALSMRKVMRHRDDAITLNIDSTPAPELRQRVLDQRLILGTVVARGAFEAARRSGGIAAGADQKARAIQNQRLRRLGIWDGLPVRLKGLLASQEGAWREAQINRALFYIEAIRVLNWFVREDCELADLRLSLTGGQDILETLFKEPDSAREINFFRSVVEAEREAGPAGVYVARLTSELVRRGASEGEYEELVDAGIESYMKYAAYVGEADIVADDLPVGGELIGEAETAVLLALRGTAAVRCVTLAAILQFLRRREMSGLEQMMRDAVEIE